MQWKQENGNHARSYSEIVAPLTSQEARALEMFVVDPSDVAIAKQMDRSPQTVRNYVASIQKKLGVRSRAELMKVVLLAKVREEFLERFG